MSVYDRTTGCVTILPTAKTPHVLTQTVKKLKSIPPAPAPTPSAFEYKNARTLLGETFGSKKAKAAIRARERNRIDVGAMEGVMDFVMEGIEKATSGLPTKGIWCASIQMHIDMNERYSGSKGDCRSKQANTPFLNRCYGARGYLSFA